MGWTWQVELFCIVELVEDGEGWGWFSIYTGESLFKAIKAARRVKKETDGAVRVTWR